MRDGSYFRQSLTSRASLISKRRGLWSEGHTEDSPSSGRKRLLGLTPMPAVPGHKEGGRASLHATPKLDGTAPAWTREVGAWCSVSKSIRSRPVPGYQVTCSTCPIRRRNLIKSGSVHCHPCARAVQLIIRDESSVVRRSVVSGPA